MNLFRFILLIFLFVVIVELPILIKWRNLCYSAWDLGIYSQALSQISLSTLNPWITVREVKIFNDHFDPILILFAPIAKLIQPALAGILIEASFIMTSATVIFLFWKEKLKSQHLGLLFSALFLFSPGVTQALSFPIHPATWAALPLILVAVFISKKSQLGFLLSLFGLFLFKEEFVFFGLGVSTYYLVTKNKRFFLLAFIPTLTWAVITFYLRPILFGRTESYTSFFLDPWRKDFFQALHHAFFGQNLFYNFLRIIMPFIPILLVTWRRALTYNWAFFFGIAPLLLVRVVSSRWGFHYNIVISVGLIGLLLSNLHSETIRLITKKVVIASLFLLIVSLSQFVRIHSVVPLLRGEPRYCSFQPNRMNEIKKTRQLIEERPELQIYAMGNLVPSLTHRNLIYQIETTKTKPTSSFLLYLEKEPYGDTWPLGRNGLQQRIEEWSQPFEKHVLFDGEYQQLTLFQPKSEVQTN